MEAIAIKFTYAIQAEGGYWIAYANRTIQYYGIDDAEAYALDKDKLAMRNAGMWKFIRPLSDSELAAWKSWSLV